LPAHCSGTRLILMAA